MNIQKVCPQCGKPMIIRKNRNTNVEFMGCSQYPACNYTEQLPESVKMRQAGALELPLFEEEIEVAEERKRRNT